MKQRRMFKVREPVSLRFLTNDMMMQLNTDLFCNYHVDSKSTTAV